MPTATCTKCHRTMEDREFYTHKKEPGEKQGRKTELCKKCMTMHINNFDPDTFKWLLELMDIPYIKYEWDALLQKAIDRANGDRTKLNGQSVFGKYLSKMRLKQWSQYGWADTERIQQEAERKAAAAQGENVLDEDHLKEMLESGEISEAEYKTLTMEGEYFAALQGEGAPILEEYDAAEINLIDNLTEEDKLYLTMKWGKAYTVAEWILLEKFYTDMMHSFDINSAAREDVLKKLCKTSLKMEQAIDAANVDEYQKLSRVYDSLSKAGKFTEAQNKDGDQSQISSVGELIAICEQEGGFIPRFDISVPQDIIDKTLMDMNKYLYTLITKDTGLSQQIEDAIKKIEIERKMEEDEETMFENINEIDDIERDILDDADYMEFYDDIEEQKEEDIATLGGEV